MPEHSREDDIGSIWRHQPEEPLSIDVERFLRRRTRALHSITRNEILMSMAAALLFVAVVAWRLASDAGPLPEIGMAATVLWVLISLYWFRGRIGRGVPDAAAMAATGREYYPQRTGEAPRPPQKRMAVARSPGARLPHAWGSRGREGLLGRGAPVERASAGSPAGRMDRDQRPAPAPRSGRATE